MSESKQGAAFATGFEAGFDVAAALYEAADSAALVALFVDLSSRDAVHQPGRAVIIRCGRVVRARNKEMWNADVARAFGALLKSLPDPNAKPVPPPLDPFGQIIVYTVVHDGGGGVTGAVRRNGVTSKCRV